MKTIMKSGCTILKKLLIMTGILFLFFFAISRITNVLNPDLGIYTSMTDEILSVLETAFVFAVFYYPANLLVMKIWGLSFGFVYELDPHDLDYDFDDIVSGKTFFNVLLTGVIYSAYSQFLFPNVKEMPIFPVFMILLDLAVTVFFQAYRNGELEA